MTPATKPTSGTLRCVYGSIPTDRALRCDQPAAEGFNYCATHGERLGAFMIQAAPGSEDRAKIKVEHQKRLRKCRRSNKPGRKDRTR